MRFGGTARQKEKVALQHCRSRKRFFKFCDASDEASITKPNFKLKIPFFKQHLLFFASFSLVQSLFLYQRRRLATRVRGPIQEYDYQLLWWCLPWLHCSCPTKYLVCLAADWLFLAIDKIIICLLVAFDIRYSLISDMMNLNCWLDYLNLILIWCFKKVPISPQNVFCWRMEIDSICWIKLIYL